MKKVSSPSKGIMLTLDPNWQNGAIRNFDKQVLSLSIYISINALPSPCQNKNEMAK